SIFWLEPKNPRSHRRPRPVNQTTIWAARAIRVEAPIGSHTFPGSIMRIFLFVVLASAAVAQAENVRRDIPYVEPANQRQMPDIYSPENAQQKSLPVVFWIHGGGWQVGDKTQVQAKPQAFVDHGFVFVSTNYRFLPNVDMETLIR